MKKPKYGSDFEQGFTLIELFVAIAVMGVLVSLALPSFQQLMNNSRIVSETNGLVGDLALARSEALRLGKVVTVCASSDGAACSGTGVWTKGRLVFVDAGTVGFVDTGETIVRNSVMPEGVTATSAGFTTTGYLAYNSTGTVTSTTPGTITICRRGYSGRVVSVSITGRVSLANTSTNCP